MKASASQRQSEMAQDYGFSQDFNVSELNSHQFGLHGEVESQMIRSESIKYHEIFDDFPEIKSFILQDSDS